MIRNRLKKEETAKEITDYAQKKLLSVMPYLSLGLLHMPLVFTLSGQDEKENAEILPSEGIGTDGEKIYSSPDYIIERFSNKRFCHDYLHMILHCIFLHPFDCERTERDKYDFATDIAVENVILGLSFDFLFEEEDIDRKEILRTLRNEIGEISAERIYSFFRSDETRFEKLKNHRELFYRDSHRYFVNGTKKITDMTLTDRGRDDDIDNRKRDWMEMKNNARIAVEVHSRRGGDEAGSLRKVLSGIKAKERDYSYFLRRFALLCEEVKINPDEFDTIYYTLGLERYGNMPLIEPLEYKESEKIRELVIAIDTSGSCQGKTVRSFLSRTYSILRDTDGFFDRVNVHIVQCDSKVQTVKKITRPSEMEEYIRDVEIIGSGGTNFAPVFDYIKEKESSGEFRKLGGLLYFTDGIGVYPEAAPRYPVAFVLPEYRIEEPDIPAWAARLEMRDNGDFKV